jgi:hypothetical protein
VIANLTAVVSASVGSGFLAEQQIRRAVSEALARLDVTHRRVLVLIPDGTRTMPVHLRGRHPGARAGSRVAALDFLVVLGTHAGMEDAQLSEHVGRTVSNGQAGRHKIYKHAWNEPGAFVTLGEIPAVEIRELTGGRLPGAD